MPVTCRIVELLDDDWLRIAPMRIGSVPPTLRTPDAYVLVEEDGKRLKRIDVFAPDQSINGRLILEVWADWVVLGYCNRLFLLPLQNGETVEEDLSCGGAFGYISDLWVDADYLLVATGAGVLRIDRDGSTRWRNLELGLDGVEFENVESRIVRGRGNWDPPDGWRSFAVNLSTGERVK